MNIAREELPAEAPAVHLAARSIGAILIDAGKLSVEDAERALLFSRNESMRFGDAAIKLGLIRPADVQYALSLQFQYPYLVSDDRKLSPELVAAYAPFSKGVEALRVLRSQLMLRWFGMEPRRKSLAIVSALRSEGRSYFAANLAVVFSQLGEHTLLIDADMRHPAQHRFFGLDNREGLSNVLAGRGEADPWRRIEGLRDLSVLQAGPVPPNPIELLGRPAFRQLVNRAASEFDVILIGYAPRPWKMPTHRRWQRSRAVRSCWRGETRRACVTSTM